MNTRRLKISLALWERRLKYRRNKRNRIRDKAGRKVTHAEAQHLKKWDGLIAAAEKAVSHRRKQLAATRPLRLRALAEMIKLVGIMEVGGNNMGKQVLAIIRANGGPGPEAWCGDTVAWAYRHAGSKVVQRGWAAVRLLGRLTGMSIIKSPLPGDIVAYKFDHTGLFKRWIGNGFFEAVEGNTGASGAVSDSRTGGDGVYIKRRHISQVNRWVRVTR